MAKVDHFIVIPTYWGRPKSDTRTVEARIFDHPTPLDGDSTLPRLLTSLEGLDSKSPKFDVIIIVACVHSDLIEAATQVVRSMAAMHPGISIKMFSEQDITTWKTMLDGRYSDILGMSNYARIRNNQLLVPHILDAQCVIALDDDEVVKPDFLLQATAHENAGIAGIYINADGTPWLSEEQPNENPYLDKPRIMNNALRSLLDDTDNLPKTPIAYGGNMVFRRALWKQAPFDPGITRGEDIDYVLNAKLAGFDFRLDKELQITHLPPHHYNTHPYIKMSEDVRRFVYEGRKFATYGDDLDISDLMPYPGQLMNARDEQIIAALETTYTEDMPNTPHETLAAAHTYANQHVPRYQDHLANWQQLMTKLENDHALRGALRNVWLGDL